MTTPESIAHYRIISLYKFEQLVKSAEEILLDNNQDKHLTTIERGSIQLIISTIKFCLDRWDSSLGTAISDNK